MSYLKMLEARLVNVIVSHVKADCDTAEQAHIRRTLLHYLVLAFATSHLAEIIGLGSLLQSGSTQLVVTVLTLCLTGLTLAMFSFTLWLHGDTKFGDKVPALVHLSSMIQLLYKDVLYFVFLITFLSACSNASAHTLQFWIGGSITGLFVLSITASISVYLKNTIPSDTFTAVRNASGDFLGLVLKTIAVVIGITAQYQRENRGLSLILQVVVVVLNVSLALYYTFTSVFWSRKTNKLMIRFMYWITILSLWSLASIAGVSNNFLSASILMALLLVTKLSNNVVEFDMMIDCFDKKISRHRKVYGICVLEQVIADHIMDNTLPENKALFYYYRGLIERHCTQLGTPERAALVCSKLPELHKLLADLLDKNVRDPAAIKIALRYQILNLLNNLPLIRSMVIKLEELSNGNLRQRIEYQHIIKMLEAKLEGYYYMKGDPVHRKLKCLKTQFKEVLCLSRQEVNRDYLNINLPLECKSLFLDLTEKLKDTLGQKRKVFDYLSELTNKKPNGLKLMRMNRELKTSVNLINTLILDKVMLHNPKPVYFYSALFVFYSTLKFDYSKQAKLRKMYKDDIQIWRSLLMKPPSMNPRVLDASAVVLQASVQMQKLGQIVDASPNAESELMAPEGCLLVGRNVNSLFAEVISEDHARLMRTDERGLSHLVNYKRNFFIRNMSGDLKEINFIMRVMPLAEEDLRIVSALSVMNKKKNHLILLTDRLGLVEAEKEFWDKVGKKQTIMKLLKSIEDLIPRIPLVYKLMQEYQKLKAVLVQPRVEGGPESSLQRVMDNLRRISTLNEEGRLIYRPSDNHYFGSRIQDKVLACNIEPYWFKERELIKLHIEFIGNDQISLTPIAGRKFSASQMRFLSREPTAKNNTSAMNMMHMTSPLSNYKCGETLENESMEIEYHLTGLLDAFGSVKEDDLDFCGDDTREPMKKILRLVKYFEESFNNELSMLDPHHILMPKSADENRSREAVQIFKNDEAEIFIEEMPDYTQSRKFAKTPLPDSSCYDFNTSFMSKTHAVDNMIIKQQERVDTPTYFKGKLKKHAVNTPALKKKRKNEYSSDLSQWSRANNAVEMEEKDRGSSVSLRIAILHVIAAVRISKVN